MSYLWTGSTASFPRVVKVRRTQEEALKINYLHVCWPRPVLDVESTWSQFSTSKCRGLGKHRTPGRRLEDYTATIMGSLNYHTQGQGCSSNGQGQMSPLVFFFIKRKKEKIPEMSRSTKLFGCEEEASALHYFAFALCQCRQCHLPSFTLRS